MGNTKPAYNFSHEVFYISGRDLGERLSFYPLGEVIHCYDQKSSLPVVGGKGPTISITHLTKGQGALIVCRLIGGW